MSYKKVIFIKLGGSVITQKSKEKQANKVIIKQLGKEILSASKKTDDLLIIGHGAGSFAHISAAKYQTQKGIINKQSVLGASLVRTDALELNLIVSQILTQESLPVFSLSASSMMTNNDNKISVKPIVNLLSFGFIPLLYGDVITDKSKGFTIFSTETILNFIAKSLKKSDLEIKMMLEIGDSHGVYDNNRKIIPKINPKNYGLIKKYLAPSKNTDVTGGMQHKVEQAINLAKLGIPSLITSSFPNNLKNAILGNQVSGTWVSQ